MNFNNNLKVMKISENRTLSEVCPETKIRRRIADLILAGGIHPITEKGCQNLSKVLRITESEVKQIVKEESLKLAGREVSYA